MSDWRRRRRAPASWSRSRNRRSACTSPSTASRAYNGRCRPAVAGTARRAASSIRSGWRGAGSREVLQFADAVLGVLLQRLRHSRHQRIARLGGPASHGCVRLHPRTRRRCSRWSGQRRRANADRDLQLRLRWRFLTLSLTLACALTQIHALSPMHVQSRARMRIRLRCAIRVVTRLPSSCVVALAALPCRPQVEQCIRCHACSCRCATPGNRQLACISTISRIRQEIPFFRDLSQDWSAQNASWGVSSNADVPARRKPRHAAIAAHARPPASPAPKLATRPRRPQPKSVKSCASAPRPKRGRRSAPFACAAARGDRHPAAGHRLPRCGRPLHPLEQEVRRDLQPHRRSLQPGAQARGHAADRRRARRISGSDRPRGRMDRRAAEPALSARASATSRRSPTAASS